MSAHEILIPAPEWWTKPWPIPATMTREEYEAEQAESAKAPAEPGYSVDPAGAFCDEE